MLWCNEMISKALYLADEKGTKISFGSPDKNLDFSSLDNLGQTIWKVDENLMMEYMIDHPEINQTNI